MFTGLVQGTATFSARKKSRFYFNFPKKIPRIKHGDSIAINGCCLTVVEVLNNGKKLGFDVSSETLAKTNFSKIKVENSVNYETALRAGDFLGGHFVTGHIDTVGTITKIYPEDNFHHLEVRAPKSLLRFLTDKGSVALDGISLTINSVKKDLLSLTIIPETWEKTNLSERNTGDHVNLEADMIIKAVVKNLPKIPR